jgi:hypothetical protein
VQLNNLITISSLPMLFTLTTGYIEEIDFHMGKNDKHWIYIVQYIFVFVFKVFLSPYAICTSYVTHTTHVVNQIVHLHHKCIMM